MDTYSIVFLVVVALSLVVAYSLGKTGETTRESQPEFEEAAHS